MILDLQQVNLIHRVMPKDTIVTKTVDQVMHLITTIFHMNADPSPLTPTSEEPPPKNGTARILGELGLDITVPGEREVTDLCEPNLPLLFVGDGLPVPTFLSIDTI